MVATKAILQDTPGSVFASSFNRAISHMNRVPCCFITAWREFGDDGERLSVNQKRRRNKRLESDIRASGLSFIKASGGFIEDPGSDNPHPVAEDTFCVIDNRFPPDRFIALAVSWCKKYGQESVLLTYPREVGIDGPKKVFKGIGQHYEGNGNRLGDPMENISTKDIGEFFTRIGGKEFVLSSEESFETIGWGIRSYNGAVLGHREFARLYPDLM